MKAKQQFCELVSDRSAAEGPLADDVLVDSTAHHAGLHRAELPEVRVPRFGFRWRVWSQVRSVRRGRTGE